MRIESCERIVVLGSPGSGKSTFARDLGARVDRPVVHLDAEFWMPGWRPRPSDEWTVRHRELIGRDEWIIDGNYGSTIEERLDAADAAVLLVVPRQVALYRVLRRRIRYRGRTRPDMAPGCPEKVDCEFLRYVWRFPRDRLPSIEDALEQRSHLSVARLESDADRRSLLEDVDGGGTNES